MKKLLPMFISSLLATLISNFVRAAEHGVITQYHHVAIGTPPSTTISPQDFRVHLEYLRDNAFNVMPLDQMLNSLRNQQAIPDKSVAITFDDGYTSIYEEAFPMLQEFGMPFTVFVSTQPINDKQRGYMSWDQIREMSDAGVLIANHMVNHHYMLNRLDNESDSDWLQRQREELLLAEEQIKLNTGQNLRYMAYPFGEFDAAIKSMLAEEGFVGLAQNSGAVGFHADFLALPRFPLASIYANLETANVKFDSLAFNVALVTPDSPVTSSEKPTATLRFAKGNYSINQIGCFANSRAIPMNWIDRDQGLVELLPEESYSGRRFRYVCTAPAGNNRFYWYSLQWINPQIRD